MSLTYCGELVAVICWCGLRHAIPIELERERMRRRDEKEAPLSLSCPVGHNYIPAGESEVKRLERRLAAEVARHDQTRAELKTAEAQRNAERAAKQRIKNRVAAGVCPCCRRNFVNLGRHMKHMHPEYSKEAEVAQGKS